ncbi:unnamed protein product, partial [Phaeothamnion confervicola]
MNSGLPVVVDFGVGVFAACGGVIRFTFVQASDAVAVAAVASAASVRPGTLGSATDANMYGYGGGWRGHFGSKNGDGGDGGHQLRNFFHASGELFIPARARPPEPEQRRRDSEGRGWRRQRPGTAGTPQSVAAAPGMGGEEEMESDEAQQVRDWDPAAFACRAHAAGAIIPAGSRALSGRGGDVAAAKAVKAAEALPVEMATSWEVSEESGAPTSSAEGGNGSDDGGADR